MSQKRPRSEAPAVASSPHLQQTLDAFHAKMQSKSMELFNGRFVDKIAALSEVFESELFQMEAHSIHEAPKKSKLDGHTFEEPSNTVLTRVIELVKKELTEFCENASTVKVGGTVLEVEA